MSEPFLGEIRLMGFNFAPRGWALCDGQLLPINQNQSLYSLLGTTYGGDGRTSFALPDLRGRSPIHFSSAIPLGSAAGSETVALTGQQIGHSHAAALAPPASSGAGDRSTPAGNVPAAAARDRLYGTAVQDEMAADTLDVSGVSAAPVGDGIAHGNMAPFLALHFCIALQGLFPSRN
jgi:microcystin-dependent protein